MKLIYKTVILILVIAFCAGCKWWKKEEQPEIRWLHKLPYSLSLKDRMQKFQRGNLLIDYSFENSRLALQDSANRTYFLKGWDKTGVQVELVDLSVDSMADKNEVFHGKKSIKIHRSVTDETENRGYGIISEYIKVIPGEYIFSCYLRLEDIYNPQERIGTRLNDAVNIRVIYYDKNKSEISSKDFFKDGRCYIDKSFKALSYANYWQIDSLPWHYFEGKAAYAPYHDAITSHDVKFVRLFIGLKGRGTMWVDKVSFKYAGSNFTLREKLEEYADTTFAKYDLILPSPKSIKGLGSLKLVKEDGGLPLIIRPSGRDAVSETALNLFEENVRSNLNVDKSLVKNNRLVTDNVWEEQIQSQRIIFCLGKNVFENQYREKLPYHRIKGRKQGYFIYSVPDHPNIVFISGNTPMGLYYGVLTAIQLLEKKRGFFHNADIIDYPDNDIRSFMLSGTNTGAKEAKKFSRFKINSFYLPAERISDDTLASFPLLKNLSSVSDINLYSCPGKDGSGNSTTISVSSLLNNDPGIFDGYLYMSENIPSTGRKSVYDGYVPDLSDKDRNAFGRIAASVWNNNADLQFLPPCHNNQLMDYSRGLSENYLAGLPEYLPGDASVIWTGNADISGNIDEADVFRFVPYFGKQRSIFLDNQMIFSDLDYLMTEEDSTNSNLIITNGLFYPYKESLKKQLRNHFHHIIIHSDANDLSDNIRLTTAAEYLWNSNGYDPELILFKILVTRFGVENAKTLVQLNEIYVNMLPELRNIMDVRNVNKQFKQIDLMLEGYDEIRAKATDKRMYEIMKIFDTNVASIKRNVAKMKKDIQSANETKKTEKTE